ncbi:hypothetical protein AB6C81_14710 [Vibrio splendidus]
MTIKATLISLVKDKLRQTEGIPELQEFFGYLIDDLNVSNEYELEEYYYNSLSVSGALRLVAWQSVHINVEFSENFIDEITMQMRSDTL